MLFISSPKATAYGMQEEGGKRVCKFLPMQKDRTGSAFGTFNTDDPEVIKKMRSHKDFGVKFYELAKGEALPDKPFISNESFRIKEGVISFPKFNVSVSIDTSKAVRFGELKGSILNKAGEFRKDADPDLIEEYELLKLELGV